MKKQQLLKIKNTATQTVNSSEQDTTTADDKNTLVGYSQVKTTENKYTQEKCEWKLVSQKDEQGNYLTGFQEIRDQNKTVYYNPDSKQMVYGQQNINGNWYLFNTFDGAMQTGLQYIRDQKEARASKESMATGTYLTIMVQCNGVSKTLKHYGDDKTVYYNQDGWMLYGQQKSKINGTILTPLMVQ